jgi:cytochrome c
MDGFEFNKIAGAVLTAMLVIAGGRTVLDIALPKHKVEHAGWNLPVTEPKKGPAAAPKPFDVASVLAQVPKASHEAGQDVFRKCLTCHTPEKGGAARVGPNLWGIVGRKVAAVAGFDYSPAMKKHGGEWSWDRLAQYLHKPAEDVPGTKMTFEGIKDETDLADLLAYLGKLGDSPAAPPKVNAPVPAKTK